MALPNEPITTREMYLSNIAGQNTALPDAPITREEMYLDYIAKTGGTGEGDMKKSIYDSDNSVATAGGIKMFVNQKIGTLPQRVGSLETTAGVLEGEVASIEDTLDNLGTASTKNSTSVVTESSDLVESGAVKDIIGWGNKNLYPSITPNSYKYAFWSLSGDTYMSQPVYYSDLSWNGLYNKIWLDVGTYVFSVYAKASENTTCSIYSIAYPAETGDAVTSPNNKDDISVSTEWARYEFVFSVTTAGYTALRFENILSGIPLYVTAWQLEKGSTATAYEPYHASVSDSLDDKLSYADNGVLGAKNLFPIPLANVKLLNTNGTWVDNVYSYRSVDFTLTVENGYVTEIDVNGTATGGESPLVLYVRDVNPFVMKKGSYTWNGCPKNGGNNKYKLWFVQTISGSAVISSDIGEGINIDASAETNCGALVIISSGITVDHIKFKPMLRLASDTDPTYQPYAQTNRELTVNKADNSVIGTVEDGANPTKSYAVNEFMVRDGAFCQVTAPVTTSSTWTEGSNYTKKSIAEVLQSLMS